MVRSSIFRRLAVPAAVSLAAGLGVVAAAGTASAATTPAADPTLTVTYPVTGSTFIARSQSTLPLGPGSLTSTADLTTGALTATLTLPPSTGTFTRHGVPVTVTTELIAHGPATGTVNFTTSAVQSTSVVTLKIDALTVGGVSQPVSQNCESVIPTTVSLTSDTGFNVLFGGPMSGTLSIPPFHHCGVPMGIINSSIPGSGNTISLTLGGAHL
jgi:hypothetical protein